MSHQPFSFMHTCAHPNFLPYLFFAAQKVQPLFFCPYSFFFVLISFFFPCSYTATPISSLTFSKQLEDSRNSLPLSYPRSNTKRKKSSQLFSPSHTYRSSSKEKCFFQFFSSFYSQFKARVILALSLQEPCFG